MCLMSAVAFPPSIPAWRQLLCAAISKKFLMLLCKLILIPIAKSGASQDVLWLPNPAHFWCVLKAKKIPCFISMMELMAVCLMPVFPALSIQCALLESRVEHHFLLIQLLSDFMAQLATRSIR